jgi:hypothetical protein
LRMEMEKPGGEKPQPDKYGVEAVMEGLHRVREMLARTGHLMDVANERARQVELMTRRATELLKMVKQGEALLLDNEMARNEAEQLEEAWAARKEAEQLEEAWAARKEAEQLEEAAAGRHGAPLQYKDEAARTGSDDDAANVRGGELDGAAELEEIVQAIAGQVRSLQRERLPLLNQPASGGLSAVKDNQYELYDREAQNKMLDSDHENPKPEIDPPASPEVEPPKQPEIRPEPPEQPEIQPEPSQPEIQPDKPAEFPDLPAEPDPLPKTPPVGPV